MPRTVKAFSLVLFFLVFTGGIAPAATSVTGLSVRSASTAIAIPAPGGAQASGQGPYTIRADPRSGLSGGADRRKGQRPDRLDLL